MDWIKKLCEIIKGFGVSSCHVEQFQVHASHIGISDSVPHDVCMFNGQQTRQGKGVVEGSLVFTGTYFSCRIRYFIQIDVFRTGNRTDEPVHVMAWFRPGQVVEVFRNRYGGNGGAGLLALDGC